MSQGSSSLRPFQRLLLGRSISLLATALIPTGLTLALVKGTGSSADLGIVLACEFFPQIAFLLVGGVVADRFRPQRVALAADVLRGAAQLAIGVELLTGSASTLALALLSVVTGSAVAFGNPTISPLVALSVPQNARMRANSYIGVAGGVALVAGPGIVGVMALVAGTGWSFVLTAALFLVSAATLGGVRTPSAVRAADRTTFGQDMRDGWRMVTRNRWFWTNLVGHGISNLTAGVFMTLGPLIAVRTLGGDTAWVVIYQSGMVGMLLGAYLAPKLRIRSPLIVTSVAAAAFALPLIALGFPAEIAVDAAAYFVAMLALGVLNSVWQTVMQQRFETHTLARADSYDSLLSFVIRPVGLALAAPLALVVGNAQVMFGSAVLVGAFNLALLALPEVRAMRYPTPTDTGEPVATTTEPVT
jgi:MFS family permease